MSKFDIQAFAPEGYEVIDYRKPYDGECFLTSDGDIVEYGVPATFVLPHLILRKKAFTLTEGVPYWFVDTADNTVESTTFVEENRDDIKRHDSGNYFETEEDAIDAKIRINALFKVMKT